jgi:hypothetical protein
MNTPITLSIGILAALLISPVEGQPTRQWSQGDPTPEEQQAMEWLNASRKDPAGTLGGMLNLAASDSVIAGFMLAQEPSTAAQIEQWLQASWQNAQANSLNFPNAEAINQAPLGFYPLFQQQAVAWGVGASPPSTNFPAQRMPPMYIYPVPIFGEALLSGPSEVLTGPNATGGTAQFGPYGANVIEVSHANLYDSSITPREWMLTNLTASYPAGNWSPPPNFLLQGDSLPDLSLGHTRMIGVDISPGQNGSQILTLAKGSSEFFTQSDLPFGALNTVFITGVAYQDGNSNGFYDPGEGISGMNITPNRGDWYAVTSSSGGYAIPVPANSGAYTLTATGVGTQSATTTVIVGADSVKVDWTWPPATTAPPVQVAVPPSDGVNQLAGFSTRGLVQSGPDALIGGFAINGPPNARKKLLIRGVGPSLQTVGMPSDECIPATRVQLMSGSAVIACDQGWTTVSDGGAAVVQASEQVGDFPLVNWAGGGGDSAFVITLPPGDYTVVASPAPGMAPQFQTGHIGLVEIYDLSLADGSRLVDMSTRGLAGPGDDQMIIGCTVTGTGHKRLLIRGSGPALAAAPFDLEGTLPDPTLALFDSSGNQLAFDANWGNSAQTAQIAILAAASGAFPWAPGSPDAAILALVPPGNVTAVIGAKSGTPTTGLALIEVYETP